jgi:putative NADH-flavin reductase
MGAHATAKTKAAAPKATEAATPAASRIAGTPAATLLLCFQQRARLAVRPPALHMTVSQPGPNREHDAVAKVLIIGASRGTGLETVKSALEAGHSVRALARSARRIPIDHRKLEKIAGDALEMATVKRALSGVDVVIQSLGVSPGPEVIFRPTRFFSKATRLLVTAMEQAHVKRLICVTGFGAGDSRSHGGFLYNTLFHLLLGRVYDDKDVQERIVRNSKLNWVIVRPVILTDGPKTNSYRALIDPRDWMCGFISRADVADFLVKEIDDDAFLHKAPVLTS